MLVVSKDVFFDLQHMLSFNKVSEVYMKKIAYFTLHVAVSIIIIFC